MDIKFSQQVILLLAGSIVPVTIAIFITSDPTAKRYLFYLDIILASGFFILFFGLLYDEWKKRRRGIKIIDISDQEF